MTHFRLYPLLLLVSVFLSPGLQAQENNLRDPIGILGIAPGDDRCARHDGLAASVEVRTQGTWFAGAAADILTSLGGACTDEGTIAMYQGSPVEVFTTPDLALAPRIRVRAGRALELGRVVVEVSGGVGVLHVRDDHFGGSFSTWYGGVFGVRDRGRSIGIEVELAMREVPVRYVREAELVREFGRFEPLLRIGVTF